MNQDPQDLQSSHLSSEQSQELTPQVVHVPPATPVKPGRRLFWVLCMTVVLLTVAVYVWQQSQITKASEQVEELSRQLGVGASSKPVGTPGATLSTTELKLADSKVTVSIPDSWKRPVSAYQDAHCDAGGSKFSEVLCLDVGTLVHKDTDLNDSDKLFKVEARVYQYTGNKNAKQWLSEEYDSSFTNIVDPTTSNVSDKKINGYDAFRYTTTMYDPTVYTYSVVLHGDYAVLVTVMHTPDKFTEAENKKHLQDSEAIINSVSVGK